MKIRDRIVELRRVQASELRSNPKNWRTHNSKQKAAAKALLREIGFAGAVLARADDDGSLILVDGHMRTDIADDAVVPVLVLDVTEAEADKLLATLDPIGAMATVDVGKLDALLREVETDDAALRGKLDGLAREAGIVAGEVKPAEVSTTPGFKYEEQYGVIIICADEAEQRSVYDRLLAEGLTCRVVVT